MTVRDTYGNVLDSSNVGQFQNLCGDWICSFVNGGSISSGNFYDTGGNKLAEVRGDSVYDNSGNKVGEFRSDRFYDNSGNWLLSFD